MSDLDFIRFWAVYPRRQGKADARKAWVQTAPIRPAIGDLLDSLVAQLTQEQWQENNGKFIPLPASWIRGERWADELKIDLPKPKPPERKLDKYDKANIEFNQRYGAKT